MKAIKKSLSKRMVFFVEMHVGTGCLHILDENAALNQGVIRHTHRDDTAFKNTKIMFETIKLIKSGQRYCVVSAVRPGILSIPAIKTPPHSFEVNESL